MGISQNLSELNWERYQSWSGSVETEESREAIFTFMGDTYTGLDAFTLSANDIIFAQDNTRILSGLYGILKPLDLIQPYRLEMGTKLENESGKIINISSVAAKAAKYQTAYYATTKMAVIAYTQALAREFGASNINVNAIAPGRILTQFHKDWVENRKKLGDTTTDLFSKESLSSVMPLGRAQSPEDIGALAAFLASEDPKNITCQTIQCDGGQVMS